MIKKGHTSSICPTRGDDVGDDSDAGIYPCWADWWACADADDIYPCWGAGADADSDADNMYPCWGAGADADADDIYPCRGA